MGCGIHGTNRRGVRTGLKCTTAHKTERNYRVCNVLMVMVRDLWLEIVAFFLACDSRFVARSWPFFLFQATNQSGEFTNFIRVFFIIVDYYSRL